MSDEVSKSALEEALKSLPPVQRQPAKRGVSVALDPEDSQRLYRLAERFGGNQAATVREALRLLEAGAQPVVPVPAPAYAPPAEIAGDLAVLRNVWGMDSDEEAMSVSVRFLASRTRRGLTTLNTEA